VPRSIDDPIACNANNIDGFVNMLTAAKETKIKRFVFASSSSVYGDDPGLPKKEEAIGAPLSPYAVSKQANELYASVFSKTYGIETIALRYFNVFGPRQNPEGGYAAVVPKFIDKILNSQSPTIDGDGLQTRDFTFVENVVQANMKALFTQEKDALNQAYNVAYGESYSVQDLFDNICKVLNVDCEAQYQAARKADVKDSLADISKARRLLGYEPRFSFIEGLKQTVRFFEKAGIAVL
jgi:UDP-N-acetylglucosamine 4-epimerase